MIFSYARFISKFEIYLSRHYLYIIMHVNHKKLSFSYTIFDRENLILYINRFKLYNSDCTQFYIIGRRKRKRVGEYFCVLPDIYLRLSFTITISISCYCLQQNRLDNGLNTEISLIVHNVIIFFPMCSSFGALRDFQIPRVRPC